MPLRRRLGLDRSYHAALVILDQNPMKIDPAKIKDIQVVETIKEGKTIYKKGG
jgi:predicted amidohydrolase YtcJ